MTGEAVTAKGLRSLDRDLKALDPALRKELRKLGKDGGEVVAAAARDFVPVESGELRGRIKAGVTAAGGYAAVQLVYAPPIHFGWAEHNIEPQPFMYEALDDRRDQVLDSYERGVSNIIERTIHSGVGE